MLKILGIGLLWYQFTLNTFYLRPVLNFVQDKTSPSAGGWGYEPGGWGGDVRCVGVEPALRAAQGPAARGPWDTPVRGPEGSGRWLRWSWPHPPHSQSGWQGTRYSVLFIKSLDPYWIRIRIHLKCWIRIRIHSSSYNAEHYKHYKRANFLFSFPQYVLSESIWS